MSQRSKGVEGMPIIYHKKKRRQNVTNSQLMKVKRESMIIEAKTGNSGSMKFQRVITWACSNKVTKNSGAGPLKFRNMKE